MRPGSRNARLRLLLPALAAGLAGACAVPLVAAADEGHGDTGIWKAVVPAPGAMRGEFANHDPIGLSAGVKVKADCSINWVDPDAGKLYCFASATSLVFFLESPHAYLASARAQWQRLSEASH